MFLTWTDVSVVFNVKPIPSEKGSKKYGQEKTKAHEYSEPMQLLACFQAFELKTTIYGFIISVVLTSKKTEYQAL
jgi:hypothetical protein